MQAVPPRQADVLVVTRSQHLKFQRVLKKLVSPQSAAHRRSGGRYSSDAKTGLHVERVYETVLAPQGQVIDAAGGYPSKSAHSAKCTEDDGNPARPEHRQNAMFPW